MIELLEARKTGFGLLVESDAGYISKDLNEDTILKLNESFSLNSKLENPILINCILQKYDVENRNGRIYPKSVLIPQVEKYRQLIDDGSAISESDHPDRSEIALNNVSHAIRKMEWKGDTLYGQIEIFTSPAYMEKGQPFMIGDKIIEYLKRGVKIGISSRGIGSVKRIDGKDIVQPDFELICFDLVASPSTPGAYLLTREKEIRTESVSKLKNKNEKLIKTIENFLI